MKIHIIRSVTPVLFAIAFAMSFAASAQTLSLPTKESREGPVRVSVTPQSLSKAADAWRFEVRLNTHVMEITEDMVAAATLSDGKNAVERPTAWEGDAPGGHHRKGVLVFKRLDRMPETITLHIREVGGIADRSFTWNLANP